MAVGQELTAHYVDECVEQGRNEMVRMKGHVARRAKELHDAGVSLDEVKAAISEFVRRRGTNALQLAEISVELERNKGSDPTLRPADRKRAKQWVEENGWPTGAKFVRGSHSGHYKYDPLGTDRVLEADWPHRKPSFDEIVRALSGALGDGEGPHDTAQGDGKPSSPSPSALVPADRARSGVPSALSTPGGHPAS